MTDKPDRLPSVEDAVNAIIVKVDIAQAIGNRDPVSRFKQLVHADRLDLTRRVLEYLWRGDFTRSEIGDVAANTPAIEALLRELEGE